MGQCAGCSRRWAALPVTNLCLSRCISQAEAVQASVVKHSRRCSGCVEGADTAHQEAAACHCTAMATHIEVAAGIGMRRTVSDKLVRCLPHSSTGGCDHME